MKTIEDKDEHYDKVIINFKKEWIKKIAIWTQIEKDYCTIYNNTSPVNKQIEFFLLAYENLKHKQEKDRTQILYIIDKIESFKKQRINVFKNIFFKLVTCCYYSEQKNIASKIRKQESELAKWEKIEEDNNLSLQNIIIFFNKIEIITTPINVIISDLTVPLVNAKNLSENLFNDIMPMFLTEILKANNKDQPASSSSTHDLLTTNGYENNGFVTDLVNNGEENILPINPMQQGRIATLVRFNKKLNER